MFYFFTPRFSIVSCQQHKDRRALFLVAALGWAQVKAGLLKDVQGVVLETTLN